MGEGIQSIVRNYIRLRNPAGLLDMKAHRQKLLSECLDTDHFSFSHIRESCREDIAVIDAGLAEILEDENVRGHVDAINVKMIAGWAQYVRYPEVPVPLEIYFDDNLMGKVLANRYRPDLQRAGLGSGRHSFSFTPVADVFLSSLQIEVKGPNKKHLPAGLLKRKEAGASKQRANLLEHGRFAASAIRSPE